nr:transcriptional repressor p66-beta [Leptinotarsa decemlineata]
MENMEVDEAVVDLSISSNNRISSTPPAYNQLNFNHPVPPDHLPAISAPPVVVQHHVSNSRRILRPRIEPRSYVESPDVVINGSLEVLKTNGNLDYGSDSSEGEMPPLVPIKEISAAEMKHRERGLRRLREELRAEEMKLVLLKKLKQSQQLKENVAVIPPSIPPSALPPTGLPSGLSITPTTVKVPPKGQQSPQIAHSRHPVSNSSHKIGGMGGILQGNGNTPNIMRAQQPAPPRANMHGPPLSASPVNNRASLSVPQPPQRTSICRPTGFPPAVKDLSPSVTITPAPPPSVKERSREDNQTPAQRQAAAKLALRKQLEKTLLQIPPPKPPPPEMHFIPNPSNTEFIYLVGLEHVVDFLTKETKMPMPPQPVACSQCQSDFTPVWKWETSKRTKGIKSVICEQCVTNNVKKALKAEHTNRLKTAFVKALQQEQEIEQRLAQSPAAPAPPPPQPTPPPPRSSHSSSHSSSCAQEKYTQQQNAATMQAIHQQLLRNLSGGVPSSAAHMLQFSPLLYPYQLVMAQAAASGKSNPPANLADIQRAADLHRQYLLDMIPPAPQQRHNWKT